jgi:hypothetical protein
MKTKTSKPGGTGSRKNQRQASRPDVFETFDALDARCGTIATLAGLLESGGEFLELEVAVNTGALIARETRTVRKLLETARKEVAR